MISHYQISKFPLPKNFKAKIHFIKVDSFEAVRVGITFDSNIINEKRYNYDEPPYKIYYKGNRFLHMNQDGLIALILKKG